MIREADVFELSAIGASLVVLAVVIVFKSFFEWRRRLKSGKRWPGQFHDPQENA